MIERKRFDMRVRPNWRYTNSSWSAADGISEDDHSFTEASLLDQLEVQPYTIREEPFSAADNHVADDHLELVDKPRPYRLRCEFRTVNSDVTLGVGLEPPDGVGIEFTLDPRPGAARLAKGSGVDDLLRCLPLLRKVEHEPWLIGNRVRGLPVHHRLVHPASVQIRAELRRKVVDVGVHLFVFRSTPAKAAMLVFCVTVQRHDH